MATSLAMPEVDRSPPAHEQVAAYYRQRIGSGEIAVGATLPSNRLLIEEWRISTHTAQRAMALLQEEGIVLVRRGPQAPLVIAVPDAEGGSA